MVEKLIADVEACESYASSKKRMLYSDDFKRKGT